MAPLFRGGSDGRSPRRRWTDRLLGIGLGLVIGLGVLVYFVFGHSEGTIDAPQINEGGGAGQTTGRNTSPATRAHPGSPAEGEAPAGKGSGQQAGQRSGTNTPAKPVPVVTVIGGAPPTDAGPRQLTFHKGEKVRFEIETDEPLAFEIRGLGIEESIEGNSIISFKATRAGQFPVIATATLIGVADLLIKPPR